MPRYTIEDDDDFPQLSRQDIVILRDLMIKIEEAGAIHILSADEVSKLKSLSDLMDIPGMTEAMMAQASRHYAAKLWAGIRAKWYRAVAWMLTGLSMLIGIVLGLDQASKVVRAWFR